MKKIIYIMIILVGLLGGYLWLTQVDNLVYEQDARAISSALQLNPLESYEYKKMSYKEQIEFIRHVQNAVLSNVPVNSGIPHGFPREPQDLISAGEGLCFDRSRFIEKALRQHGFETRHIAIYSTAITGSSIKSLLTPQVSSHAVTEVLTSHGWLVVDSNERWISLGNGYQPVSIDELSEMGSAGIVQNMISMPTSPIYANDYTFVYGLYSRHGMFYPPYDRVPDINIAEILQNITRAFK